MKHLSMMPSETTEALVYGRSPEKDPTRTPVKKTASSEIWVTVTEMLSNN